jgi:tubulin-specific chaperone A
MSAAQLRDLKIKSGAVKRTTKEYIYYFKELKREKERLEKMKSEGKDEYDIKQQDNVVSESGIMIPETKKSLEQVLQALQECLAQLEGSLPEECAEKDEAIQSVQAAKEALETEPEGHWLSAS